MSNAGMKLNAILKEMKNFTVALWNTRTGKKKIVHTPAKSSTEAREIAKAIHPNFFAFAVAEEVRTLRQVRVWNVGCAIMWTRNALVTGKTCAISTAEFKRMAHFHLNELREGC